MKFLSLRLTFWLGLFLMLKNRTGRAVGTFLNFGGTTVEGRFYHNCQGGHIPTVPPVPTSLISLKTTDQVQDEETLIHHGAKPCCLSASLRFNGAELNETIRIPRT